VVATNSSQNLGGAWEACAVRGSVKFTTETCGGARGRVEDPGGAYFTQICKSAASNLQFGSIFLKTVELGGAWWPATAREAYEQ
jgi:hypothetical protein